MLRGFGPRWIESQTCFWACSYGPIFHTPICAYCHCHCVDGICYVKAFLQSGGRICHYMLDRAESGCWSSIKRRQQEPRPNFSSKGDYKHVRRKARTWFKSCEFKVSPNGGNWRNHSPGPQSRKNSCGPYSLETAHSGAQQSKTLPKIERSNKR